MMLTEPILQRTGKGDLDGYITLTFMVLILVNSG